jgi:hypothetical protein
MSDTPVMNFGTARALGVPIHRACWPNKHCFYDLGHCWQQLVPDTDPIKLTDGLSDADHLATDWQPWECPPQREETGMTFDEAKATDKLVARRAWANQTGVWLNSVSPDMCRHSISGTYKALKEEDMVADDWILAATQRERPEALTGLDFEEAVALSMPVKRAGWSNKNFYYIGGCLWYQSFGNDPDETSHGLCKEDLRADDWESWEGPPDLPWPKQKLSGLTLEEVEASGKPARRSAMSKGLHYATNLVGEWHLFTAPLHGTASRWPVPICQIDREATDWYLIDPETLEPLEEVPEEEQKPKGMTFEEAKATGEWVRRKSWEDPDVCVYIASDNRLTTVPPSIGYKGKASAQLQAATDWEVYETEEPTPEEESPVGKPFFEHIHEEVEREKSHPVCSTCSNFTIETGCSKGLELMDDATGDWACVTANTPACSYYAGEGQEEDDVNHPSHYTAGPAEVIEIIEAEFGFEGHLSNVIKYVLRANHKGNKTKDLQKAKWYLDRYLEKTS